MPRPRTLAQPRYEGQSGSIFATSELLLLRSPRQMLMKLSVPAQANISDCVDKGVLSLTAAGVQLVAQHRASAMGMWQAFAQPPAAAEAGPIVECWPAAATAAPAAP